MKFIDSAKIFVASGNGGNGHVSFRREKFVEKGGPDGGNGGRGGDVIFVADPHRNTLLEFNYVKKYIAEHGTNGGKSRKTGKDGDDIIIKVPLGTQVYEAESDEIIIDVDEAGKEYKIASGGRGGLGNSEFATAVRQTPRFAQEGKPGQEFYLKLELKLLADVGLVGFPNAGKSTLIASVSAARPKIADYPFTTLVPNLGVIDAGNYQSFTIADVPGIIKGASDGKGLGIQFLKHIERTKILLYLIDSTSETIVDDYLTLKSELLKFNPELSEKTEVICFSKVDCLIEEQIEELEQIIINGKKPLLISSHSRYNLDKLVYKLFNELQSKNI